MYLREIYQNIIFSRDVIITYHCSDTMFIFVQEIAKVKNFLNFTNLTEYIVSLYVQIFTERTLTQSCTLANRLQSTSFMCI